MFVLRVVGLKSNVLKFFHLSTARLSPKLHFFAVFEHFDTYMNNSLKMGKVMFTTCNLDDITYHMFSGIARRSISFGRGISNIGIRRKLEIGTKSWRHAIYL